MRVVPVIFAGQPPVGMTKVCFRCAGGAESEVGIVHNEMRFEIFQGDSISRYAPHCRILVPIFDKCWGNEVRMHTYCQLRCNCHRPHEEGPAPACNHNAHHRAGNS